MICSRHTRPCPARLRRLRRGARAFTLVEILLVLALLALLGSLLISGASGLMRSADDEDPQDALLAIMQTVRRAAVADAREIDLLPIENWQACAWDDKTEMLPVRAGVTVRLIRANGAQSVLIGGMLEETPVERLRFYPDGTCDPVRIQVVRGDRRTVIAVDPWTCAPMVLKEGSS